MNAVEIEEALSALASEPFDRAEFPFAFLTAFGNKNATIKRLRKGDTNASDVLGGVLQRNNIHIAACAPGAVHETLQALRASPKTMQAKAKFILATDGETLEAEDMASGEMIACEFIEFPDHFGFFLPLAGISTIKEIKDNPVDVRATGRLNKLYVELLQNDKDWAKEDRRSDMNHFMARLVFCFFAEDTDIFQGASLFTKTLEEMTERDGSNTPEVLETIFRAMNVESAKRPAAKLPRWAERFPYVNGGLFSGSTDVPKFTRTARSYLLRTGELNWKEINPDIFGSMIQAVADDEERGALGMHYTSVPNILKVLNPLFLDDLRAHLEEAGDNKVKLLNLRKRMARIRVFDPACGSGNFLVIAYKQMRAIEAEINQRRGEINLRTEVPLTNFRGIELRDFPAEIARLALIIAEFQCDMIYRGQKEALAEVLPLDSQNWITSGNALRLDWLSICPPAGPGVKLQGDDLFNTPLDQAEIDFENEGGEIYICGNPPYKGGTKQSPEQKSEMEAVFSTFTNSYKSLDYVSGWFFKFAQYARYVRASCAFVSTNSISQGEQVARLWPLILDRGLDITFAHTSFKWANLATYNAGVTVVIIGLGARGSRKAVLFEGPDGSTPLRREVDNINPYLIPFRNLVIDARTRAISDVAAMVNGSKPVDGGNLIFGFDEAAELRATSPSAADFIYKFIGANEAIDGSQRFCLWIKDHERERALRIDAIRDRITLVKEMRERSPKELTKKGAKTPWAFQQARQVGDEVVLVVPSVSSERREYLPTGLLPSGAILSNLAFGFFDAPLWNMALVASKLHLAWIAAVCGKHESRYRYSSTLGWNTFPVPILTDQNTADLTRCAEDILLAREVHYPATIADLYDPEAMPENLRQAHERNDEVLERIYIGRRFRNDTERLEKLFDLYTKMTANLAQPKKGKAK
jgi:hypothetical protein